MTCVTFQQGVAAKRVGPRCTDGFLAVPELQQLYNQGLKTIGLLSWAAYVGWGANPDDGDWDDASDEETDTQAPVQAGAGV